MNPKIEDPDPEPILNQVQHKVQDDMRARRNR